jgi:hypothetical protein
MTTYNRQTGKWLVPVSYSGVSYIEVEGVDDEIEARAAATKAVLCNLAGVIENSDITVGIWPMSPDVKVLETTIEAVEVL